MHINELLATTSIADQAPRDALHLLGTLVNHAMEHHDRAAATHAISLTHDLPITDWAPPLRAYAYYTLANAHDELRRHETTPAQAWHWSLDFDASLLRLRQAKNDPGFDDLPREHQCQILTNLANNLNTIGRTIAALDHWNEALTIDPNFSMARANRAYGLLYYGAALYDPGHQSIFAWHAYHDFNDALPGIPYPDAKNSFTNKRDQIAQRYQGSALKERPHFDEHSLGNTPPEIAYRTWCVQHRLFLNPLNDVTTNSIAANDVLLTPTIVTASSEPPLLLGLFNQVKQEYTTARFVLHEGLHHRAPHYPDKDVKLWNTLDYPTYGTNIELVKLAFRSAYSPLDKIAYFLNHYFHLGISSDKVNFFTLWYDKRQRDKGLRPTFVNRANLPLRGLFWLSRDLSKHEERYLGTDATRLASIRDHLEHKYLKTHEREWVLAQGDPFRDDTLAHNIARHELETKALRMTKIAREALIALTLAVHIEEQARRRTQTGKILPMHLDLYDDNWKQ